MLTTGRVRPTLLLIAIPALLAAQRGRSDNPFPGGTNPDGSLRPTPPVTRLFTQDAYTEYAISKASASSRAGLAA